MQNYAKLWKYFRDGVLAFCAGLFFLGLLEGGARLVEGPLDVNIGSLNNTMFMGGEAPLMQFVKDPVLGYRLQNNSLDGPVFRDQWNRTHPREKSPDVFRIICLGGSTTFGTCANPDTTYPAQLEALFAQSLAGCGKRVEVINAGTMGYNSWHSLLRCRTELDAMQPDLYLVMDGLNDVITSMSTDGDTRDQLEKLTAQVNLDQGDKGGKGGLVIRMDKAMRTLAVYRLMRRAIENMRARGMAEDDISQRIARFGYERNMADLIRNARDKGIGTVIVNYPWIVRDKEDFPEAARRIPYGLSEGYFRFFKAGREYISSTNRELARSWGVAVVDPQAFVDTATQPGMNIHRVYCDTVHFTRLSNFFISSAAFNLLKTNEQLVRFLGSCTLQDPDAVLEKTMRAMDLSPQYLDGSGFPADPGQSFETQIVSTEGLRLIEGDVAPWKVYTPANPNAPGRMEVRVTFGKSQAENRNNDFNAVVYTRFSNPFEAVVLHYWDGSTNGLSHPEGRESRGWSAIAERFGLTLPAPQGRTETVKLELFGSSQLWTRDGRLFFFNLPKNN